ncbi:long-chain fatty acid--CoA ligase [Amycolatopsis sp. cg5]|uniref:acyl-CoA synthetase n=1 Tax=Amycolatopsis sp. cg5 TaxID=3238802 RepID=UPI00352454E1
MNELNRGIGSWPARRARGAGDRTALIFQEREYSYIELERRVTALAASWRAFGIGAGDRVAYLGPNHPALLETLFSAGLLGAVFVPLNTRLAPAELTAILADAGASLLVHGSDISSLGFTGRTVEVGPDFEALATEAGGFTPAPVGLDDPCLILYTSGTTGRAKGVVLTHGNLTWNAMNVIVDVDLREGDVALVTGPLFHTAALNVDTLPAILKGGTVVLTGGFDPDETIRLVERYRVCYTGGVPTMHEMLTRSALWENADLTSLRFLFCGGSPVPVELVKRFQDRGIRFQQGYGMTEASPGVLMLAGEHALRKPGSAGIPHFFTDVRLADSEVQVSGPNVSPGYWNAPDAQAASFTPDGWLRTGDIVRFDDEGFGWVVGRVKDMIISGGENIYPAEVETVLIEHPAVADCAVVGVPDPKWGEVPAAFVVPEPGAAPLTESDLLTYLTGRLAKYKVPKTAALVDALPRNASGKLDKPAIKARYLS